MTDKVDHTNWKKNESNLIWDRFDEEFAHRFRKFHHARETGDLDAAAFNAFQLHQLFNKIAWKYSDANDRWENI